MNLRRSACVGGGCALFWFACHLFAQPEQWLQYHTGDEAPAYQWIVLLTNQPPNLALPQLQGKPVFARWKTPMDKAGFRWICLDRTTKRGIPNKLFIDSNGNGRLDDDPAVSGDVSAYAAIFDPARVVFQTEDGPVTYHVIVRYYQYDRVYVSSACWYEGDVDFGGKKYRVRLVDSNVNGAFDDIGWDTADTDRLILSPNKATETDQRIDRYLGRLVEVDGQLFRIEVARDGAFVKVEKARDIKFGTVTVPETISEFTAAGPTGHFTRNPSNGSFTLPAGNYQILSWTIERKDNKGATWQLVGDDFGANGRFALGVDQSVRFDIGEPVLSILEVTEAKSAKDPISVGLKLQGRLGESVTVLRNKQRPQPPKLVLASVDGTYRKVSSFQFG
ncbi:MAG TPA: hypothetical protein PLW35_06290 [Verrucomicrobiota bacterium]|nr:hypothetical protein [Verrucomicrobiota bacterium]